jgi:cytochrome P450
MRLLVKHQNVLSKLRNEIKAIVGVEDEARSPDRNDIKKMLYLTYVLKEVLRLYPSVPINSRAAVKTTTLPTGGGADGKSPIFVKKGAPIGYCVYAMHRRKDLYGSDAEKFRPERWDPNVDNEVSLKNIGWGYLPFNGGPRVCLGQEFALLETSYVIVRLLQTFREFEHDPAHEMAEVGQERQDVTLVLASSDGCHIRARS